MDKIRSEGEELLPVDPMALTSASKGGIVNALHTSCHEDSFKADSEDKGVHKAPKLKESGDKHGADDGDGDREDTEADIRTLLALVDKLHKKNKLDKGIVEELRRQLATDSGPAIRLVHTPAKAPVVIERASVATEAKKSTPSLSRLKIDVSPLSPAACKVSRHRCTSTLMFYALYHLVVCQAAKAAASRRLRLSSSRHASPNVKGANTKANTYSTPHSRNHQSRSFQKPLLSVSKGDEANQVGDTQAQCGAACSLQLQLLSVWDAVRSHGEEVVAGLTQIEIYDAFGKQMKILPDAISISAPVGCGEGPTFTRGRLVDARVHTTNPEYMWTCPIPATISIQFTGAVGVSKVCIWNYNHSNVAVMERRCVKQAAITLQMQDGAKQLAWRGEVQTGCGNKQWTYCEEIELCKPQKHVQSISLSHSTKRAVPKPTPSEPPIPSTSIGTAQKKLKPHQTSQHVRVSTFGRRLQIQHDDRGGMHILQQKHSNVDVSLSIAMNDEQRASVQKLLDSKMDWLPDSSRVKHGNTPKNAAVVSDGKADNSAHVENPAVTKSVASESAAHDHDVAMEKLDLELQKPTTTTSIKQEPLSADAGKLSARSTSSTSRRRRSRRSRSRKHLNSDNAAVADTDKGIQSTRGSSRKSRRERWVVIDDSEDIEGTASVSGSVTSSRSSRSRSSRRRHRRRRQDQSPLALDNKLEAALSSNQTEKVTQALPVSPSPAPVVSVPSPNKIKAVAKPSPHAEKKHLELTGSNVFRYNDNGDEDDLESENHRQTQDIDVNDKSTTMQPNEQSSEKLANNIPAKLVANEVSWNPFGTKSSLDAINVAHPSPMETIGSTMMMTACDAEKDEQSMSFLETPTDVQSNSLLETDVDTKPDPVALHAPPRGQVLKIVISSNWGDAGRVGLNGIEVYDSEGDVVSFPEPAAQISSRLLGQVDGTSSRCTSGHSRVSNLLDGVNFTMDETHMWATHWTAGSQTVELSLDLRDEVELGFICIWNFNHSRMTSTAGIKTVHVSLDEEPIWAGQVAQAQGLLSSPIGCCEVLTLTRDPYVLKRVQRSAAFNTIPVFKHVFAADTDQRKNSSDIADAVAADTDDKIDLGASTLDPLTISVVQETMHKLRQSLGSAEFLIQLKNDDEQSTSDDDDYQDPTPLARSKNGTAPTSPSGVWKGPVGHTVSLDFRTTWGDPYYLGLTGLSVTVRVPGEIESLVLPLDISMMKADPPDINCMGFGVEDTRTLDKLVDGVNLTTNQEHMWLIPFTHNGHHTLDIQLPRKYEVLSLTIWNYNKTPEDTLRGAKKVDIRVDGTLVSPPSGAIIRKAPGESWYKFGHTLDLARMQNMPLLWQPLYAPLIANSPPQVNQDYDTIFHPHGLTFKLVLTNSWTDPYYIGLNGVEFFAIHSGTREIYSAKPTLVDASPRDINTDENKVKRDCRVPSNLIDGCNSGMDGRHAWLAPRAASLPENLGVNSAAANEIVFLFEEPVCLVAMRVWNYVKTPGRGACEIQLWADDTLILMSELKMASSSVSGFPSSSGTPTPKRLVKKSDAVDLGQSFLFSDDPVVVCTRAVRAQKHTNTSAIAITLHVCLMCRPDSLPMLCTAVVIESRM